MATTTAKSKTAAAELRDWPLMENNIAREDLDAVIQFLQQDDPILTQSKNVAAFEQEWSEWLGVRYSSIRRSRSFIFDKLLVAPVDTELGKLLGRKIAFVWRRQFVAPP